MSESGLFGMVGQANYSAAKAGIASMTLVLAREMKKYGVTVNAVAPRARTRMTATVGGAEEFMAAKEGEYDAVAPGQRRAARRASSRRTTPRTSAARCS